MPRSRSTAIQSERTRQPLAARLDFARQLDRPAKQQQFLGQRGLAGVGVRNDRKGAPAQNLVAKITHQSVSVIPRGTQPPAASALNLDNLDTNWRDFHAVPHPVDCECPL
jgi:hypothetical protein